METTSSLGEFVASQRKALGMTQEDLARRAGVSLQLVRDIEQGHRTGFNTNKVNQLLRLLGYQLGPVPLLRDDKRLSS